MARPMLALALLSVIACESDEAKLERLKTDKAVACLGVEVSESGGAYTPTEAQRTKCDLARRALNKFMDGR